MGLLLHPGNRCSDPNECSTCCDLIAATSYLSFSGTVVATGESPGGFTFTFVVKKNGTTVHTASGVSGVQTHNVTVVNGDVVDVIVTLDRDPVGCIDTATCVIADSPAIPACYRFDPIGAELVEDECITGAQLEAAYVPFTSRTVTVSGLTGDMAVLNGDYTVSCGANLVTDSVSWSGGLRTYNYGEVRVQWFSEYSYEATVSSMHSDDDACVATGGICIPGDTTRIGGNVSSSGSTTAYPLFYYQFKRASCGSCTNANKPYQVADASNSDSSTSNGVPAEDAVLTWS